MDKFTGFILPRVYFHQVVFLTVDDDLVVVLPLRKQWVIGYVVIVSLILTIQRSDASLNGFLVNFFLVYLDFLEEFSALVLLENALPIKVMEGVDVPPEELFPEFHHPLDQITVLSLRIQVIQLFDNSQSLSPTLNEILNIVKNGQVISFRIKIA